MSDMEERGRRASQLINEALPYLDTEQTVAIANAIAGAAMTNQMVAQMRNAEPPRLMPELMGIRAAQGAMA